MESGFLGNAKERTHDREDQERPQGWAKHRRWSPEAIYRCLQGRAGAAGEDQRPATAAVAEDLGVGLSTLGKWVGCEREADLFSGPHADVTKELARLWKKNDILR